MNISIVSKVPLKSLVGTSLLSYFPLMVATSWGKVASSAHFIQYCMCWMPITPLIFWYHHFNIYVSTSTGYMISCNRGDVHLLTKGKNVCCFFCDKHDDYKILFKMVLNKITFFLKGNSSSQK